MLFRSIGSFLLPPLGMVRVSVISEACQDSHLGTLSLSGLIHGGSGLLYTFGEDIFTIVQKINVYVVEEEGR